MALTGLGRRPDKPSYEYALVGHPELDAVLIDWEPDSWEDAGRGRWTASLDTNLGRIADQLRTAPVVAEANYFLDPVHRGYQIIQTQPNCGKSSVPGPSIGPLTGQLIGQYRGVFGLPLRVGAPKDVPPDMDRDLLQHVGFEVAFDQHPNPKASEAERIGPEQTADCTDQILKAGGAGVLYWASPDSTRAMLDTPAGRTVRPPTA